MNQLALSWEAAERGIQSSAEHAEDVLPGWAERAYRELLIYKFGRGGFTSEDFRDHLTATGFAVPVPKALGAVFKRAAKRREIQRVGFAKSRDRHCSPIPLWEAA